MSRYAYSVMVNRRERTAHRISQINSHSVAILEANSKFEAEGLAMAIARKCYPVADGWTGHHAMVCSIENVVDLEGVELGELR